MTAITGSLVALLTPMLEDGRVDYPGLRKLIDWHIAEGTNCIVVVGTTGESPTVTVEEHREIIRGLNSRDPAKAAAAMKAHLDAAYRSTVAVLDGPGLG